MAGVEEGRADTGRDLDRLLVIDNFAELMQRVGRVDHGVEGRRGFDPGPSRSAGIVRGLAFLKIGRIEDHEIGELARGGGGDDRALETALAEERQAAAMVEMGMG